MENISNQYIEDAIQNLAESIGIKDYVDENEIISLVRQSKVKESIEEIAKYLKLPIKINLSYVPKGYRPENTNTFHSSHLVKTDWRGRGSEGIVAQISIPSCLPMYGSSGLNNFQISVRVSENCTDRPATFIAVIAHELSHIVLHSIGHKEKDNEIYTDITAMMLGFSDITRQGRRVIETSTSVTTETTVTTTYGYLSDENFYFAFDKVEETLRRHKQDNNKIISKIKELAIKLKDGRKEIICFRKYLEYVDKHLNRKISQEDGYKISTFHQPGYYEELEQEIYKIERDLKKISSFLQSSNHYISSTIKKYEERINAADNNIDSKYDKLYSDVKILKKHVSLIYRLKVFIR